MNKIYSFYIDESGLFQRIDTHVICPLVVEDNALGMQEITDLWSQVYPQGWTGFHATRLKNQGEGDRVLEIAEALGDALFARSGVRGVYAFHRSKKDFGYDFYLGMLVFLLKWQSNDILNTEVHRWSGSVDETLHIHVNMHIAERQTLNPFLLKSILAEHILERIQELVKGNALKPGQVHFDFFPYYYPISQNPFMQVSDLFCYLVRAYLINGTLGSRIDEIIEKFAHTEIPVSKIRKGEMKAQSHALRSVGEKIVYKETVREVERTIEVPVIQHVPQRPWIERYTERALELQGAGKQVTPDRVGDLITLYRKDAAYGRRSNIQLLMDHALHTLRVERNYRLAAFHVDILYDIIQWERGVSDLSPECLDRFELETAEIYVTANNHRGNFLATDPRVGRALAICEQLRENMACWLPICSFHTHLAVAFQNVFRFDEAIETLFPIVQYYERELKNPFSGGGAQAYEIGALFGTYAQSLAFSAHCRFFTEGPAYLSDLESAELYSLLAEEHFEKLEDRERQVVYRAHFKMQRYILSGDRTLLEEAGSLLDNDAENRKALQDFREAFPEKRALNPAYRIVVLLKHACLSQKPPGWLDETADLVARHRRDIPADHPMEQMIPYIILLTQNPSTKRTLMGILLELRFPRNIVSVIRDVLLLQINYAMDKKVDGSLLDRIDACISDDIRPHWERYGLERALDGYKNPINRWHVGPMEVLPFNYA